MRNTREKIRDFYHTLKLFFIKINSTDSSVPLVWETYVSHSGLRLISDFLQGASFLSAWRTWFVDGKRERWGCSDEIILIDGYGLCTPDTISPDTKSVLPRD